MNCRRARNLLFDFFDGASNETLRAEVDRHLGECGECDKFASEMTSSLALLRRVPVEPVDENFNWKVRLAIHREKNAALERVASANAWVRAWNMRYAMSTGLAFAAVLVAGSVLMFRGGGVPASLEVANQSAQHKPNDKTVLSPVPANPIHVSGRNGMISTVSTGNRTADNGPAPQGAIDEAKIDSLISLDVMRVPERERDQYIQRRINAWRAQLSQQPQPQH